MKEFLLALVAVMSCSSAAPDGDVYTLYRSSVVIPNARVMVATFDEPAGGAKYNAENCSVAARLFANQPAVIVSYWCENGRARNVKR